MILNDKIENTKEEQAVETKVAEKQPIPSPLKKKPIKTEPKEIAKVESKELAKVEEPEKTEDGLEKLIAQWKIKYGKLFKNYIDEDQFIIWRGIKRKEYKELLEADEQKEILAKQEAITKLATLYPENIDELIDSKAGLATVLSEEILKYSGFGISETEIL